MKQRAADTNKTMMRNAKQTTIREITAIDYPMLEDFLYNAVFIPAGVDPPPKSVIFDPEIYIYIKDFDINNHGDCGVVAEIDEKIMGMAWTRIIL
ncbi:MAG: hypothetical protein FWG90_13040 [Oscillospiraceae bacterium]|nr:hypothetical protein [Oscillospiraceae bacterium]